MPEEKPFPFCGCILDAFYTNGIFDTVCVTYTDEHGVNRDWYMEVDETDERFKSLLKEYTYEELEKRTNARNLAYGLEFEGIVKRYIDEKGLIPKVVPTENTEGDVELLDENEIIQNTKNDVWNFIYGESEDKEELFKLKLSLFNDKIGKDADRQLKAKVRKGETVLQVLSAYNEIVSANNA